VAEKYEAEARRTAQLQTELQRIRSHDLSSRVFSCAFLTEMASAPKLERLPTAPRRSSRRGSVSRASVEEASPAAEGRIAELEAQLAAERRARQEAEKVHQREKKQWERGREHDEIRDTCRNW